MGRVRLSRKIFSIFCPTRNVTDIDMITPTLTAFRVRYQLRRPEYPYGRIDSQCVPVTGFAVLGGAPVSGIRLGKPPRVKGERSPDTYLWVIDGSGIPYIIEAPLPELAGKCPKHTNLTGDGEAYLGGELWFCGYSELFVSGGSGRYPPHDPDQLECAVDVFRSFGYCVTSLGWDPQEALGAIGAESDVPSIK